MGAWMDGWIAGCVDERMDGWVGGLMDGNSPARKFSSGISSEESSRRNFRPVDFPENPENSEIPKKTNETITGVSFRDSENPETLRL